MPKTYLTKQDKLNNDLAAWIYGTMRVKRISQSTMAEKMGIKQPSLNYKLRHGSFTFQDLTTVFEMLEPDARTLTRLMGCEK